jgi:hypothetical protein
MDYHDITYAIEDPFENVRPGFHPNLACHYFHTVRLEIEDLIQPNCYIIINKTGSLFQSQPVLILDLAGFGFGRTSGISRSIL